MENQGKNSKQDDLTNPKKIQRKSWHQPDLSIQSVNRDTENEISDVPYDILGS